MEQLRRWREPLALTLVIAGAIRLLIGIVAVPALAGEEAYDSLSRSAMYEAGRTFDVLLVLALALAAGWCLSRPASPRATGLAVAALIVIGVGLLASLGFGLLGLADESAWRGVEFGYTLIGLVVPALAVIGLLFLLQSPRPAAAAPVPGGAEATVVVPPPTPGTVVPPALPPTWQPDQASGRAWTSAGDAARGAPHAQWPAEGGAGWQPIPGQGQPPRSEPPTS